MDDLAVIVEVLSAFIRRYLHAPAEERYAAPGARNDGEDSLERFAPSWSPPDSDPGRIPRADVVAAISVLAMLPDRRSDGITLRADFSGLDFTGVRLDTARLAGADLAGANLKGAYLDEANLSGG